MDLSGVLTDATSDFIMIAGTLISAIVVFWGIKAGLGLLRGDVSSNTGTYSSGHLNDSGYMGWLKTQDGASNNIGNKRDRYDEPYQNYLDRDRR